MIRAELGKQVTEMIFQALSDESIKIARPLNDFEMTVLSATIERMVSEAVLEKTSDLVTEPHRLTELVNSKTLDTMTEIQARKTLRRFHEIIISLSAEPEVRILN